MNRYIKLFICILIPLSVGGISGIATASGLNVWFQDLEKPFFNPPSYLFGPVWTALYVLMGISLYLIAQSPTSKAKRTAYRIFGVQLALNFVWSFLFFKYQMIGLAFVEILLIWVSIVTMIVVFNKIDRTAAILQYPYLLWVTFASVLNGGAYRFPSV
ncbi:MAG: tryptophan-rich sensory protein [Ignavibacteria bacterium]|nr:tryptophan-rich sensory protein [Ignavibacteria bacterium]